MKHKGTSIIAIAAAACLLLSLTLTSCTSPMKEAKLEASVDANGCEMPAVSGFMKSDSINGKLEQTFAPLAQSVKEITDQSDGRLRVEYRMEEKNSGILGSEYLVTMYLTDGVENLELKSVKVSGFDDVSDAGSSDSGVEWITSADLAGAALTMQHLGIAFDRASLGDLCSERDAVDLFIRLYESLAGHETDISEVSVSEQIDDFSRKAMLLHLIPCSVDYPYEYSDSAYTYRMLEIVCETLTDIERDVYGRQSETVLGEEFTDMLRTVYETARVHEVEGSEYHWSALGTVDLGDILHTMELEHAPFTRRDAAELLGRITKSGPKYAMTYSDRHLERIEDSLGSIWVRRAITHGFMNYYGESTLFAPDEGLTVVNALSCARTYYSTRYNDWLCSVDYAWDGNYTNADVLIAAARTAEYFSDRTDEDKNFEVKTVINDRDYNWFYSQHDTGPYSAVNCMPTIATMASHWYDQNSSATVEKMRDTNESTDGWYPHELRHALDVYNVPYTIEDATMSTITDAIDDGKIVLAQYSDRPEGMSGHCYVIYGYKSFKDSITFIVNDSDSLRYRAQLFGRENGNGDELEANFSMWSISRFVSDVTVVG